MPILPARCDINNEILYSLSAIFLLYLYLSLLVAGLTYSYVLSKYTNSYHILPLAYFYLYSYAVIILISLILFLS